MAQHDSKSHPGNPGSEGRSAAGGPQHPGGRQSDDKAGVGAMVRCPVCGMEIRQSDAAGTAVHEGRVFHFCSTECKTAFDADPANYVDA